MKVVHCKKEPYDVYIGRPGPWGNPFSHKDGTLAQFKVNDLAEALSAHKEWFLSQPELVKRAKRELKGKTLGCWCKPGQCHGDILLKVANENSCDPEQINNN